MYGGKRIFLTGIAATSILTMVTPLSTWAGTGFLIAVRFLEGLFEGMTYPSIHAIWAKYVQSWLDGNYRVWRYLG